MKHKKKIKQMADAIITDTETSKKDIVRLLNIPEKRVTPIYLAPPGAVFHKIENKKELSITQKKYNLPNTFVLYVGDVNYNKNIPTLIKACEMADVPLVIVGKQAKELITETRTQGLRDVIRHMRNKPHPEESHFIELENLLEKNKNIYRLGFVSDEDLVAIFNLATLYCQPSFYEGFGLVPLQAFACGTAVVNAKTQALVEVGDDAALYADPNDPGDMARTIERVIQDAYLRASLIRAGERRAKEFSWAKTAEETYSVYQHVFQQERRTARKTKKSQI